MTSMHILSREETSLFNKYITKTFPLSGICISQNTNLYLYNSWQSKKEHSFFPRANGCECIQCQT